MRIRLGLSVLLLVSILAGAPTAARADAPPPAPPRTMLPMDPEPPPPPPPPRCALLDFLSSPYPDSAGDWYTARRDSCRDADAPAAVAIFGAYGTLRAVALPPLQLAGQATGAPAPGLVRVDLTTAGVGFGMRVYDLRLSLAYGVADAGDVTGSEAVMRVAVEHRFGWIAPYAGLDGIIGVVRHDDAPAGAPDGKTDLDAVAAEIGARVWLARRVVLGLYANHDLVGAQRATGLGAFLAYEIALGD